MRWSRRRPSSGRSCVADLVTLRSDALTASIHPLGAELWSLADSAGRQLMTDADPAFWTGRAPLLFPIVGALAGDSYRLGDRTFAMAFAKAQASGRPLIVWAGKEPATWRDAPGPPAHPL